MGKIFTLKDVLGKRKKAPPQREEGEGPYWSGECTCAHCRHEWVGVGPVGTINGLYCPSCGLNRGTVKNSFAAPPGSYALECGHCGADMIYAYKEQGETLARCSGCGNDMTDALFS